MDVNSFPAGVEFLEPLTPERPDCVVLDLHMPVMNGFEVQAQLADLRVSVPVVIITGHDSDETRALALAGFPVAYLRKPVNDQLLLDAIALALRRSQQQLGARNDVSLNVNQPTKEADCNGKIAQPSVR